MRLLALSAALLILSLSVAGQAKNDSKIIVAPSDTARLFDKLITLLYTEGYTVKQEDKGRGFIVTDEKTLNQWLKPKIRLRLLVGEQVTITGEVNTNVDLTNGLNPPGYEPIKKQGVKGSIYGVAWAEMDRIAKIIGTTNYSK